MIIVDILPNVEVDLIYPSNLLINLGNSRTILCELGAGYIDIEHNPNKLGQFDLLLKSNLILPDKTFIEAGSKINTIFLRNIFPTLYCYQYPNRA